MRDDGFSDRGRLASEAGVEVAVRDTVLTIAFALIVGGNLYNGLISKSRDWKAWTAFIAIVVGCVAILALELALG